MAALMRACALAPEHPAVLIAFYRHYFYSHRLRLARAVARKALVVAARSLGLPLVWRAVPEQALAGAKDDVATRFYLWVLKGYAYLSLRLDDPIEARDALAKLRMLDPDDRVGAALLEAVRQRRDRGDAEDEGPALPVFGAAAWARVTATGSPSGRGATTAETDDIASQHWQGGRAQIAALRPCVAACRGRLRARPHVRAGRLCAPHRPLLRHPFRAGQPAPGPRLLRGACHRLAPCRRVPPARVDERPRRDRAHATGPAPAAAPAHAHARRPASRSAHPRRPAPRRGAARLDAARHRLPRARHRGAAPARSAAAAAHQRPGPDGASRSGAPRADARAVAHGRRPRARSAPHRRRAPACAIAVAHVHDGSTWRVRWEVRPRADAPHWNG